MDAFFVTLYGGFKGGGILIILVTDYTARKYRKMFVKICHFLIIMIILRKKSNFGEKTNFDKKKSYIFGNVRPHISAQNLCTLDKYMQLMQPL